MKTMLLAISMLTMASTVVLADPCRRYHGDMRRACEDVEAAKIARAEIAADKAAAKRAAERVAEQNGK
jgi:hypothetical protein